MSWKGVVWREAGEWDGGWSARRDLGIWTFAERPTPDQILDINGTEYVVIAADIGFCVVKPRVLKAR